MVTQTIREITKPKNFVDCIMCGYCCGYRRDSYFGGCSYSEDEEVPSDIITVKTDEGQTIPVDADDVCIYLEKLNNGFARCGIQERKPRMCKLFYCLPEQKIRQLKPIVEHLKGRCE